MRTVLERLSAGRHAGWAPPRSPSPLWRRQPSFPGKGSGADIVLEVEF